MIDDLYKLSFSHSPIEPYVHTRRLVNANEWNLRVFFECMYLCKNAERQKKITIHKKYGYCVRYIKGVSTDPSKAAEH